MRIDRLDLTAYGCFTNAVLDLAGSGRNMVVVYGENEAGKSTALNAIGHWLFGFEKATENVAFIHRPGSLRIKGTVSDGAGNTLTAIRRKGKKDTLLADDGKTVLKDGELDPLLKSITSKQFKESFGLTLQQLKEGGKDLAAGKGNFGAALFAAASGIVSLQKLRSAIARRKESLFVPRGVNPTINAALRAYSESKKAWEASLVPAVEADRLDREVKERSQALDSLRTRRNEVTATRNALSRLLRGRTLVLKSTDLQRQREPLRDVVPLDPSFAAVHTAALAEYRKAEMQMTALDERLHHLDEEIAGISVDEPILAVAETVTTLAAQQQSMKKLDSDLTADQQLVQSTLGEAKQALRALGLSLENPDSYLDSLRLNDREKRHLRKLATDFTKLSESMAAADRTWEERDSDWRAAVSRLDALAEPVVTVALVAAVEEVNRAGDPDAGATLLSHEITALSNDIEIARQRLGCSRTVAEIPATSVPSFEVIGHHRDRLDSVDREVTELRERQRGLETEAAREELDLARVEATGSIPRPEELKTAREKRNAGWELIRRAWLAGEWNALAAARFAGEDVQPEGLARIYTDAVTASDGVADQLTAQADRVRERLDLLERLRSTRQQLKSLDADAVRTAKLREDSLKEWRSLWTTAAVTPRTPREMMDWRRGWDQMCERIGVMSGKQAERARKLGEIDTRRDRIRRALFNAGESPGALEGILTLGELAAFARRTVKQHEEAAADRRQLEQKVADAEDAVRAADFQRQAKRNERTTWELEWTTATTRLATAGLTNIRADQLDDVLDGIDDFYNQMKFRRGKIIEMEERRTARSQWQTDIMALAERLGELSTLQSAPDPTRVSAGWAIKLKASESARDRLADRIDQRDELREQRPDREAELGAAKEQLDRLVLMAQAETAAELPERITRAAELRELNRRIETEYREPMRELAAEAGCSAEEIERQVTEASDGNLPAEIDAAEQALADLDPQRETAARSLGEAERRQDELLNRRGGIDDRERLESALARIRQNVPEYATLVLAEAVLARAIDRYRDRNKSELFETASRLFGLLTCGRFVGLELEHDDNDEQYLVGVRPVGVAPERIAISGMSDGTCDQLYLALRLAHLEKHVTDHGPFPIIVDDLLLAFDDDRARAALRCLVDLSRHTQVVFFTHHRHLRDIAAESEFQGQIGILDMNLGSGEIGGNGDEE